MKYILYSQFHNGNINIDIYLDNLSKERQLFIGSLEVKNTRLIHLKQSRVILRQWNRISNRNLKFKLIILNEV